MLLHSRPLLRVNTSAIESDGNSITTTTTTTTGASCSLASTTTTSAAPTPGVVKHVWVDTSSDDIVIVTEKNTLHFCRINAVTHADSALLDILTLHPAREATAARRFVSRTSAKMHAGLCAATFDAERLLIFNASRNTANPIGTFSCQPNSLRFRDPYYPILRFEWVPQRVGCNYDTSRIYLAVVCSICIELVQVFPLASSQDTAVRKLQRFVTHTDFCAVDPTSRRLSILSVNSSRKGVLKFFVVNDPVAEAHHNRQYLMYNTNTQNKRKSKLGKNINNNNNNMKTAASSTTATPGASAHNSPSVRAPNNNGKSESSNNNTNIVIATGDPTIEHHLELKIDEEAVVDPQFAFREMFPDAKNKTKAPNYFYRLITIYAEHYCAVVTRSEVVLYRYDSSIPFFSARPDSFVPNSLSSSSSSSNYAPASQSNNGGAVASSSSSSNNNNQPLVVRPYRSFVLNLPQSDKYSLLVLDNEIILQSLTPPFLSFSYDIALDQSSTANMRDLELTECMRRVGGLGNATSSNSAARAASPLASSNNSNNNNNNNNNASFLLNPMMTAASGPNFNPVLSGSFVSGGKNGSGGASYMTTPSNLLLPPNLDQSSYDYYANNGAGNNNKKTSETSSSSSSPSNEPSAFSKLANLLSLPTLHVSSNSNARLTPLKPKIPSPLENVPLPELAGGGGIFCDTSEPIFLSLGTDFLQRLAAGGQTRLPPEQMVSSSNTSNNNNNNSSNTTTSTWSTLLSGNSSKKKTQTEDLGNPNSATNGCNAANIEVYLIGKDKAKRDVWMNLYSNSSSPQQSQNNSPAGVSARNQNQQQQVIATATATSSTPSSTITNTLLQNTGATASLCARGGAVGRDNFRALFSNAIRNQQSLGDIEKLLDDAVAGFILASCAVEPPISVSGMRVVGRWQLDHGSSAKRSGAAPWAMPLLSEAEVRVAERGADVGSLSVDFDSSQQNNNDEDDEMTNTANTNDLLLLQQQQDADLNNNDVSSDDNRGRRGRLESSFPLVIAGAATASNLADYGTSVTAPAAHLQLVIAEILSTHVHEACIQNATFGGNDAVSLARLRYLRGVGLEVLRCFRCLIIYPLQQAIVDSYVCGLTVINENNNNFSQQPAMTVGGDLMDLWGLLQLISFRFLAESPQLAAKLIEVGVKVRIRQLVQAGLDMLGRLGAFHELGTVLLHLGDVLAAVRIACKHNLQVVASKAIVRAYLMDKEFAEKGKECFSAAAKRKLLPLVLMMLRSRGGGGGASGGGGGGGAGDLQQTQQDGVAVSNTASPREVNKNNANSSLGLGQFSSVIESTLKGLQLA